MLYFDTETTGLDAAADVLEFALVDDQGNIRLAARCAPVRASEWPEAQQIHGIAPADVAGLATWPEIYPAFIKACEGQEIVIYNAPYDLQYCPGLAEAAASVQCAMTRFAEAYGEWSDRHNAYKWVKLVEAARHAGFEWPEAIPPHSALGDCLATRHVWHYLNRQKGAALI